MSSFSLGDGAQVAVITALTGGVGWLATKGLPSLYRHAHDRREQRVVRIAKLHRENGQLKRALLILVSAIELGVSFERLVPYVRSARRLLEDSASDLDDALVLPEDEP